LHESKQVRGDAIAFTSREVFLETLSVKH